MAAILNRLAAVSAGLGVAGFAIQQSIFTGECLFGGAWREPAGTNPPGAQHTGTAVWHGALHVALPSSTSSTQNPSASMTLRQQRTNTAQCVLTNTITTLCARAPHPPVRCSMPRHRAHCQSTAGTAR